MGGEDWRGQIDEHLESAEMILILVSADFLGSDYCYDVEMRRALERHRLRQARVIPIILRPSPWRESPLSDLQALPDGGKAVTEWTNRDAAFSNITDGIRNVVQQLQSN
jgi:internalin A